jgi:hypothetical protein
MRSWNIVAILLCLTIRGPSHAAVQAPDAKPDLGANAAMKYWQAFALLPNLDKDQEKLLQDWNKVPLNAAAQKLIDGAQASMLYLHRGAKLPRCDWSLDYEDGIGLRLTHCPNSLTLARLAALHARHELEQGHWKAGWEDVTAILKLGRDVGMGPQFVVRWVGYRIEAYAIEAAAPYLPELKSVIPKDASAVLDTLPAGPTLRQMILGEKQTGLIWLINELKEAEKRKVGGWQGVWKNYVDVPWLEGETQNLVRSVKTSEQAIRMLEDVLPFYDELAKVIALPWREFDGQYPELVKNTKTADPLGGFDRPKQMDAILGRERRYQAQTALFKAALAVVQEGPNKLRDIKDPFGDGPFEYSALDTGFELKSKLLDHDKPVRLTVGQRMKK